MFASSRLDAGRPYLPQTSSWKSARRSRLVLSEHMAFAGFYLCHLAIAANRNARAVFKNLNLLCCLGEIERCVEDARCCRGSCSPNPPIVVRREV